MQVTAALPVLASGELDIFDADQRRRTPTLNDIARATIVPVSAAEHAFAAADISTPRLTPRAIHVLEQIEQAKQDIPTASEFLNLVAAEIRRAGDSRAVLDRVLGLIATAEAGK